MTDSNALASKIGAITLFTEDREAAKASYRKFLSKFLSAEPVFEDDDCAVFMIGDTMLNVLRTSAVPELIEPSKQATEGLRSAYTIPVEDVDKAVTDLSGRGIEPQSGPIDRPWGIRTANYVDPDGHLWELSCDKN